VLFQKWQSEYAVYGIPTFPVEIGPEGKKPLVRHYGRFGLDASTRIAPRFRDATAIGFMVGRRSRITALDIDTQSEEVLISALDRHGQSPIIIRTGSGNYQAWYRWNGEGRIVRPDPRVPIDILGGGFVVAPPSLGIKGKYQFLQGNLGDIDRLPTIRALPLASKAIHPRSLAQSTLLVKEGRRNGTLFRECMRAAHHCDDFDQLLDVARTRNADYSPPLTDEEVMKVATSAWRYETRGENWVGRGKVVALSHRDVDLLATKYPDALALLTIVKYEHWARPKFVLSNTMAKHTLGWTLRRFKAARQRLLDCGLLRCVHPGGRGPHDPPWYALA